MFLSLTNNNSSTVSGVILLPWPSLDRWRWWTSEAAYEALDASQHMCISECVGTLRSSGGRVPFPHPSLPIISCPDKTPVCWRLQDQTVMSRQLSSQHTADARWLPLRWVPGFLQNASGGQLIREGNCDIIWCMSSNHNHYKEAQWLHVSSDLQYKGDFKLFRRFGCAFQQSIFSVSTD